MELTQKQIEEIRKCFDKIIEVFKEIVRVVKEAFLNFINSIGFNKLKRIIKHFKIYRRTKNARIKKKQLKFIMHLLE